MPATTIHEVIERLNEIVLTSGSGNKRAGYFAALYKKVTIAIEKKIKENYFDDNERMERLDVVFANRFLDAYDCYHQKQPCTQSWQLAFDACDKWQPMVMHHLLTGMNAHIGLDLGIATAIVSTGNPIEAIHNDFNKINTVLCELITEVKTCLYQMWPLSKFISKLNMGKLENDLAGFSMTIARDAAWEVAVAYAAMDGPGAGLDFITARDKAVHAFGGRLLNPGGFVQTLTGIARVFEFGTIAGKIRRLDTTLPIEPK